MFNLSLNPVLIYLKIKKAFLNMAVIAFTLWDNKTCCQNGIKVCILFNSAARSVTFILILYLCSRIGHLVVGVRCFVNFVIGGLVARHLKRWVLPRLDEVLFEEWQESMTDLESR